MTDARGNPAEPEAAERLAAMGRLAGELMHDLSNLVAVLDGRTQLALAEARNGRTSAEQMERIAEITEEMSAMVRDTMDFLRGRAISPEVVFSPAAVAERVISRFMSASPALEVRLLTTLASESWVAGRASLLARTLANLLTNASRHARTQIRVTLAPAADRGQRWVRILVEDDGSGVPEEMLSTAFRPFVRGAEGGTGLGLSSVEWATRQLGGEVHYRPDGGDLGGACFEVLLPIVEGSVVPRPRLAPGLLTGRRVGVVDDQPVVRSALSRLLRRLGAEVEEVSEGESAHSLASAVLRGKPDVILLDLKLGAHTGVQVWEEVQRMAPEAEDRIVFMSGLAPSNPLFEAASATGRPILSKPFDLQELADVVRAVAKVE